MKNSILVVDDEADMLSTCKAALDRLGAAVRVERRAQEALVRLEREDYDLMVSDIKMPDMDGIELLKAARRTSPDLPVILMTAYPEVESAVEALRYGALDYLIKPFHPDDLEFKARRALDERRLKGENRLLARRASGEYKPSEIVGESGAVRKLLDMVEKVAATPADVLILGESGTGKELVARRLHVRSGRTGHFVPVDCGAIPEHLLENELFGHEKGAYTDASSASLGLVELAHQGTFFMDEICELPAGIQAKLLRVLQERQFRRVGGTAIRDVDIRVIAATNRDITAEVREGRFREDLYYRINVVTLRVPPLRERASDVRLLVEHLLPRLSRELGKDVSCVDPEALDILERHPWPGNVRELQNALKRAIVLCEARELKASDLPESLLAGQEGLATQAEGFAEQRAGHLAAFERSFFQEILDRHQGSVKSAAEAAGLPLSSFYWYLKKHRIKPRST